MHIAIVLGPFLGLPPDSCGAVERIWGGLAPHFLAQGHQVTFLLRRLPGQPAAESVNGIQYLRAMSCQRTGRLGRDLFKDLYYSLRMAVKAPRADILITNTFFFPLVQRLFPLKRQRLYVAVHRFPKNQMRYYLNARRLAAVSTPVADAVIRQTPAARAITRVISNPIDTRLLTPPDVPRSAFGPQTILFTGRIHPEKGLHLLIDAFAQIAPTSPELRLRLIGPWQTRQGGGGQDYLTDLKCRAGTLPVEFVEPIFDMALLAGELRAAHYYVYPSLADLGESFGVAPLEAMATGLAPILSDLPVFRDFASEGQTATFFDHRSPDALGNLARALQAVRADPSKAAAMGAAAAIRARDFSYENIAQAYLRDFQSILHPAPADNPQGSPDHPTA